jgi:hypothetical protein
MAVVRSGTLLKHEHNVDVAFHVSKSYDFPDSSKYKLKGFWVNIGYTEQGGWRITNIQTIEIPKEDFEKWQICLFDRPTLRESTWRNLKNRLWG